MPACAADIQEYCYIIGLTIGVGHGLVIVPFAIVAAVATPAKAVIIATAANSFAKFCGFIYVPPIFNFLYSIFSNGDAKHTVKQ